MTGKGYSSVDATGFVSAGEVFEQDPWKDIQTKKYDSDEMIAQSAFASTPTAVVWKLSGV